MKKSILISAAVIAYCILPAACCFSQGTAINSTGSAAHNSAILDLSSTSQGFVLPRMTTAQRNAIVSPVQSLMIFNTDTHCLEAFDYGQWQQIWCSACPAPATVAEATHIAGQTQIEWIWYSSAGAAGYKWNTVDDYGSALNMGTDTVYTETNLTCGTGYTRYVWAYNTCASSTAVLLNETTSACPWSCGLPYTDSRDGTPYNTTQIGSQCWLAQNLNIGTKINSNGSGDNQTDNSIIEKYCYDNDINNCNVYGGLYQWAEMVQYLNGATNTTSWAPVPTGNVQGICPSGWHLPSQTEWTDMENYLGGDNVAGGHLKETGFTHWASPNTLADNSSGFTALPGGLRQATDGSFAIINTYGCHWVTTEINSTTVYMKRLDYNNGTVQHGNETKARGFTVRCIKD